jgi:fructoselysine-6-P-deglycase FrlB-like protein
LTPIGLAVLPARLAYRVAVARRFNPDSPREIRKVTRTR